MATAKTTQKTTNIISLRLPESMIHQLKTKLKDDFYLDISEAIRDIVRNKYLETTNSTTRLHNLTSDIVTGVSKKVESNISEQVLSELHKVQQLLERRNNE